MMEDVASMQKDEDAVAIATTPLDEDPETEGERSISPVIVTTTFTAAPEVESDVENPKEVKEVKEVKGGDLSSSVLSHG